MKNEENNGLLVFVAMPPELRIESVISYKQGDRIRDFLLEVWSQINGCNMDN